MVAFLIQMTWLFITRRAQSKYLADLVVFRKPTGRLARYYQWRVDKVQNSVIDGLVFEAVLIVTVIAMVVYSLNPAQFGLMVPIVVFVIIISSLSVVQNIYRVNNAKKRELRLLAHLKETNDKIATARSVVLSLIQSDQKEDGRVWFALYKIAQRQDTIGWSVRDVLLDKGLQDRADSLEPGAPSRDYGSRNPDTGPGIN
jgi:hypothetical protein